MGDALLRKVFHGRLCVTKYSAGEDNLRDSYTSIPLHPRSQGKKGKGKFMSENFQQKKGESKVCEGERYLETNRGRKPATAIIGRLYPYTHQLNETHTVS